MSLLTIIRGLPGSGKTTLARKISGKTGAILIEPDALCVSDCEYRYGADTYRHRVELALSLVRDIANRAEADIIYADVLPTRAEVRDVIAQTAASLSEYRADVVDLHIAATASKTQNRHNVKSEDIDRMAASWEDWA